MMEHLENVLTNLSSNFEFPASAFISSEGNIYHKKLSKYSWWRYYTNSEMLFSYIGPTGETEPLHQAHATAVIKSNIVKDSNNLNTSFQIEINWISLPEARIFYYEFYLPYEFIVWVP